MYSQIITSTEELERIERATYALITYYNYIKAWVIYMERQYGEGEDGINKFIKRIKCSDEFNRIQGGALIPTELINAYARGRLTLYAMNKLPIEECPELASFANFWLPVQSYYAIHGVGLATIIALGRSLPRSHRSFRAEFSELVCKYFPDPFCGRCLGGPEPKDFSLQKLSTSMDMVRKQSQLANPEFVEDPENLIGKSLSTTRQKFLEIRLNEKRREMNKKRLSCEVKTECCQKEHATSVCDLIYRMRVRSNYDNPDMYLFASDRPENAIKHYKNLVYLTEMLLAGLDTLTERRIGRAKMQSLKSMFEQ